jgi:hypothetical protein
MQISRRAVADPGADSSLSVLFVRGIRSELCSLGVLFAWSPGRVLELQPSQQFGVPHAVCGFRHEFEGR